MANEPRSLDVSDPQIIVHFPQDAGGFYWHHRLLLVKVGGGLWIGLTPDGDLQRVDLRTTEYIALDRRAQFPRAQAPYVYAFDDLSRAELESFRRRAQQVIVGESVWLVADVTHDDFGKVVEEQAINDGVVLGDAALIQRDGVQVYVVKVAADKQEEWKDAKNQIRGDLRLLGDHRDSQGKRSLTLREASALFRTTSFQDWPMQGPRATVEFLSAILKGPGDMASYHLQWLKASGVSQYGAIAHEHRVICECLRLATSLDQIDVTNLASFEHLVRRCIQLEAAVARSPASPDFSGLDLVLDDPIAQEGHVVPAEFNAWLAGRLKERAQVQKQARLYREEFSRSAGGGSSSQPPTGGAVEKKGKGKGDRKAKKDKSKRAAADGDGPGDA
ncbi:unnamed protein product [Effrenium voratum]|nr:unnamed protein product [Effrenium voratum]